MSLVRISFITYMVALQLCLGSCDVVYAGSEGDMYPLAPPPGHWRVYRIQGGGSGFHLFSDEFVKRGSKPLFVVSPSRTVSLNPQFVRGPNFVVPFATDPKTIAYWSAMLRGNRQVQIVAFDVDRRTMEALVNMSVPEQAYGIDKHPKKITQWVADDIRGRLLGRQAGKLVDISHPFAHADRTSLALHGHLRDSLIDAQISGTGRILNETEVRQFAKLFKVSLIHQTEMSEIKIGSRVWRFKNGRVSIPLGDGRSLDFRPGRPMQDDLAANKVYVKLENPPEDPWAVYERARNAKAKSAEYRAKLGPDNGLRSVSPKLRLFAAGLGVVGFGFDLFDYITESKSDRERREKEQRLLWRIPTQRDRLASPFNPIVY